MCSVEIIRQVHRSASTFFGQQFIDSLLKQFLATRSIPIEFAKPPVADATIFVDQIDGRPNGVAPGVPRLHSRIDHDRMIELMFLDALANVVGVALGLCLRRVNAQNCEILTRKRLFPTLVPRVIAHAIDSAKSEKVERDNFPFEIVQGKGLGIDPLTAVHDLRSFKCDMAEGRGVKVLPNQ